MKVEIKISSKVNSEDDKQCAVVSFFCQVLRSRPVDYEQCHFIFCCLQYQIKFSWQINLDHRSTAFSFFCYAWTFPQFCFVLLGCYVLHFNFHHVCVSIYLSCLWLRPCPASLWKIQIIFFLFAYISKKNPFQMPNQFI